MKKRIQIQLKYIFSVGRLLRSDPEFVHSKLCFFVEALESFDKEMQLGFENENSWAEKETHLRTLRNMKRP